MRKKTEPHTRTVHEADSSQRSGLIADHRKRRRSVAAKPVLDNRSHRTSGGSRRRESTAQPGEAVSGAFHKRVLQHSLRRQAAPQARRCVN
jgi:hypothetical protein